jgi:formiminotetrahydrofolate cyclodeaminase
MSTGDVPGLTDLPLTELLERFAARTAAPGGGSAAATACALAAALVQMAAEFDLAPESKPTARRASVLRSQALELGDRDLRAYAPVLEAFALPGEDESRSARIAAALWCRRPAAGDRGCRRRVGRARSRAGPTRKPPPDR